jgi:hypothetical protein
LSLRVTPEKIRAQNLNFFAQNACVFLRARTCEQSFARTKNPLFDRTGTPKACWTLAFVLGKQQDIF